MLISLLTINTILLLLTGEDLPGQSFCDTTAGPFIVCEEPPVPHISFSQLEEILNNSINIKSEHIIEGDIIRIVFIINCEGEDFNYRTFQPVDSTIKAMLFKTIHSNMKWTAGRQGGKDIDCQQQIHLGIVNGKIVVLNDNDKTGKKRKK